MGLGHGTWGRLATLVALVATKESEWPDIDERYLEGGDQRWIAERK